MELDIIQDETLNKSKHTKNKSFDDNEINNECKSPFRNIRKQKPWSSANNLNQDSNTLTRRSIRKTDDKDISITINSENSYYSVDSLSSSADESVDEKINNRDIFSAKRYLVNLSGYFYYTILTSISTIIFNSITKEPRLLPIDNILFVYLSPIMYKLCFRPIFLYSMAHDKKIIRYIYPISFFLGFSIRYLDYIPFFRKFVLNTHTFVDSGEYIALFCVLLLYLFLVFFNELYQSTYKKLNFLFLIAGGLFIYITVTFSLSENYIIHVHHYFLGLVLHIVCQTKRSLISVINNSLGLGIFLEGISMWGFAPLYYRI